MASPLLPTMRDVPFAPVPAPRIGLVGAGGRGRGLLHDLLAVPGAKVVAVADRWEEGRLKAAAMIRDRGHEEPVVCADAEQLVRRGDLDLVLVASRWDDHVPHAIAAMEAGIHVAVEVPAATTLDDCWRLVDTSERTRRHCILLENCCYGWQEMLALNLIRAGVLGVVTHAEAGYVHDLRDILFENASEGLWRRDPHRTRDGNHYPTHGLGPVAAYLDIHRGDRFTRLVSMSSQSASLADWRDRNVPGDDPRRAETYVCGDMNSSLLQTARGRTVLLQHDVVTPRPYTRLNLVQGTRGAIADYPPRIHVDGRTAGHDWEPLEAYKEFEDPLWTRAGTSAQAQGGHGGMDYLMLLDLVETLRRGGVPRIDVYDAAAWSAPFELSERSVASGNLPVDFPDFTRGRWGAA